MIEADSNTVAWVLDGKGKEFIEAHSIIGLAADEQYVYGTTSVRNGYGIPDTDGPAQVFKLDIETRKRVWQTAPVSSAGALCAPRLVAGWLLIADMEGLIVVDPQSGKLVKRHRLTDISNKSRRPGWASADLVAVGDGSKLVHSAGGTATVVNFRNGNKANIGNPRDAVHFASRLAVLPSGKVFSHVDKTVLVELDLEPKTAGDPTSKPTTSETART